MSTKGDCRHPSLGPYNRAALTQAKANSKKGAPSARVLLAMLVYPVPYCTATVLFLTKRGRAKALSRIRLNKDCRIVIRFTALIADSRSVDKSKSVHKRMVDSGGNFCVFCGGDLLHCYSDSWLIVEV
jgi:hypothetical protein